MQKPFRVVAGFTLLNLFVGVLLFGFLLADFADYLVLEVESEKPFTVNALCGPTDPETAPSGQILKTAYCEGTIGEIVKVRMWLPEHCHRDNLRLEFSDVTSRVCVRTIKFYRKFAFVWKIDFVELASKNYVVDDCGFDLCESRGAVLKSHNGQVILSPIVAERSLWKFCSLSDKYVIGAFMLGECAIVILSLLLAFFTNESRDIDQIARRAIVVAVFAGVFYCLILPCQSYLVNESVFPFKLDSLIRQGCIDAVLLTMLLFVGLVCFDRIWGGMASVVVTFFLIYEYLETGLFSIGDAQLNGEIGGFLNGHRMVWDSCVMVGLLGTAAAFYRFIYKHVHWIALAVFVLAGLSLFDVKTELKSDESGYIISDFASRKEVADAAYFSTKRNVILFVLDMATSEVALDVMKRDERLRQKFSGFMCFRNNLGMHMYTPQATTGIFTGQYLKNPAKLMEYVGLKFSEQSFIKKYVENDIPMFIMTGDLSYAYSNRVKSRQEDSSEVGDIAIAPFYARIQGILKWNLFEIVALRSVPYVLKSKAIEIAMFGWPQTTGLSSESELYPILGSCKKRNCDVTLHYYHTDGAHEPLQVDRNGHRYERARFDYDAYLEKFWYALKNLGILLDELRRNKLYDNSLILICSDHGGDQTNGGAVINGMPNCAQPFLWVKPEGVNADVIVDETPTSHSKISLLMEKSFAGTLSRAEIVRVLRSEDRFYRRITGSEIVDYHADATGTVRIVKAKSKQNPNDLRCLRMGEMYSFHADKKNKLDFLCEGLEVDFVIPRMMPASRKISISIRVPDPTRLYDISLFASLYNKGDNQIDGCSGVLFSAGELPDRKASKLIFRSQHASISMQRIAPRPDGIITIEGVRDGDTNAIFIDELMITKVSTR